MSTSILLADDSVVARRAIRNLVTDSFGDAVAYDETSNGLAALEKAIVSKPDVVVLDIAMPGLNGVDIRIAWPCFMGPPRLRPASDPDQPGNQDRQGDNHVADKWMGRDLTTAPRGGTACRGARDRGVGSELLCEHPARPGECEFKQSHFYKRIQPLPQARGRSASTDFPVGRPFCLIGQVALVVLSNLKSPIPMARIEKAPHCYFA